MRDTLDDLSKVLLVDSSEASDFNAVQTNFAKELVHLADLRDWEVHAIDSKVLTEVQQYDEVCKAMRDEVKINASIRGKETIRKRAAEQQRRGSTVFRADRDFEKIVEDFETQKNSDLKRFMMDFLRIQLKVHLESINRLTSLYNKVKDVDCAEDVIKFRDSLLEATKSQSAVQTENQSDQRLLRNKSHSMGALNTFSLPSNPFRKKSTSRLNQHRSQEDLLDESIPVKEVKDVPKVVTHEDATEESLDDDSDTQSDTETDEQVRGNRLSVPRH